MVHFLCLYLFAVIPGLVVFGLGRKRLGLTFLAVMIALVGFGTFVPSINAGNALLKLAFITEIGLVIYTVILVIRTGIDSRRQGLPADDRLSALIAAYEQNPAAGIALKATHVRARLVLGIVMAFIFGWMAFIPGMRMKLRILSSGMVLVMLYACYINRQLTKQPAIVLSQDGISTLLYGKLPWAMIMGLHFSTFRPPFKGKRSQRSCVKLYIPKLDELAHNFKGTVRLRFYRLRGLNRTKVSLGLNYLSEPPEAIYGLARYLWTKYTGQNYEWDPDYSAEVNCALQRVQDGASTPAGLAYADLEADARLIAKAQRFKKLKRRLSIFVFIILVILLRAYLKA